MPCPNSNNPQGLKCPTTRRRYADIGHEKTNSLTQTKDVTLTLQAAGQTVTVLSRKRRFTESDVDRSIALDAVSCQMASGSSSQYFYATSYDSEFSLAYQDVYETLDAEIKFLDLRHDIVVWKEHKETTDTGPLTSSQSVPWNQYGVTSSEHAITPGDLTVTVTETDHLNGEVLATKTSTEIAQNPYTIPFPVIMGTPQGDVPEQYYLWPEHKDESGGLDLYYPIWLQSIGINNDMDLNDRNAHLVLSDGQAGISALTVPPKLLTEQTPSGSWAVDLEGNRFFSQRHLGGNLNRLQTLTDNVLVTMPDADLKALIPDLTDVCYPVSIT